MALTIHQSLPWLTLLFILLDVGVAVWVAAVLFVSRLILRPPRMTDGRAAWLLKRLSPGDLGLAYENVEFFISDVQGHKKANAKLRLTGWWIAHPQAGGRCVVLLHGYGDAKVCSIAWAPMLHNLRVNILALDLRAHGESGGTHCTAGFFERYDVAQVIDQLRLSRPQDIRRLVLFGISMGCAVSLAVACDENNGIDGVILDSPVVDHRIAISRYGRMASMPGGLMMRAAVRLAEEFSGARFDTVRALDLIQRITAPLMIIHGGRDLFVTEDEAQHMEDAAAHRPASGATVYWKIPQGHHVAGMYVDPHAYRKRVGRFLDEVWKQPQRSGSTAHAT